MDHIEKMVKKTVREGIFEALVEATGNPYVATAELASKTHELLNRHTEKIFTSLKERKVLKDE